MSKYTQEEMSVISSMMVTLLDDYDYHGITIRFSGDYTRMRIGGVDYQLPVFKIDNPNDLPYSMPTIIWEWADEELGDIGKLINIPNLRWDKELLRFFNNTHTSYYIPPKMRREIEKCLNTPEVDVKIRKGNIIYTVTGSFSTGAGFEMYWDNSEDFRIFVDFNISKVWEEDLNYKDKYGFLELDPYIIDLLYNLHYDDNSVFENLVWHCFEDLVGYRSFIDRDWQFISVSPNFGFQK